MHEVKRWHCAFCTKVLSKKGDMARHEERCPRNPESKSCGTCEHLLMDTVPSPTDPHSVREVPYCELAKFSADNRTPRNPFGLRSNCPFHVTDPYRFD